MTRYRIILEHNTVYVEYKWLIFWRRVCSGFGYDQGWRVFKNRSDAMDFILEWQERERKKTKRQVLWDTGYES